MARNQLLRFFVFGAGKPMMRQRLNHLKRSCPLQQGGNLLKVPGMIGKRTINGVVPFFNLWELSKSGKIRVEEIYRQMAFGQQTDKEVSVPGDRWRRYITTDRTVNPVIPKTAINEIIAPGYIENLRPERRFDQTLYFTARQNET